MDCEFWPFHGLSSVLFCFCELHELHRPETFSRVRWFEQLYKSFHRQSLFNGSQEHFRLCCGHSSDHDCDLFVSGYSSHQWHKVQEDLSSGLFPTVGDLHGCHLHDLALHIQCHRPAEPFSDQAGIQSSGSKLACFSKPPLAQ